MKRSAVFGGWSSVWTENRKRALEAEFHEVALPQLDAVYRAACYLSRDTHQAEDLVQETYLRAFQYFDRFEPGTNCKAWLLTILRNLFISQYHQKKRRPDGVNWEQVESAYGSLIAQSSNGEKSDPESLLFSRVLNHEIEQALKELPEEYRTAVISVDIEDLSYEEAARVMECPVGTVRSRLSRGRRLLQVALRDYAVENGLLSA